MGEIADPTNFTSQPLPLNQPLLYNGIMSAQHPAGATEPDRLGSQPVGFDWRQSLAQILALSAALFAAYVWLSFSSLAQYSLQVFALCILLYFILKKLNDAAVWEVLPTTAVDEMILVTFAFLILIGATGGAESIFFPLIFIYLFFLSMTMHLATAITLCLEVLLFLYALSPSPSLLLVNIPIVMTFFLFAKYQYDQAKTKQTIIEIESNELNSYQVFLQQKDLQLNEAEGKTWGWVKFFNNFVFDFLQPKIDNLIQLVEFPQNHSMVKGQLTLIRLELEKLKQHLIEHGAEIEDETEQHKTTQHSTTQHDPAAPVNSQTQQNVQNDQQQNGQSYQHHPQNSQAAPPLT